jgi:type I restriction enzyme S subunit
LKFKDLAWSYFAYYFLCSNQYLEYAEGAKSGSVQSGMNARVITDVDFSIPPDEKVVAFYETIKPLRNKIVANLKESRTLASLRDTLLPKLMRGEVRVREV